MLQAGQGRQEYPCWWEEMVYQYHQSGFSSLLALPRCIWSTLSALVRLAIGGGLWVASPQPYSIGEVGFLE